MNQIALIKEIVSILPRPVSPPQGNANYSFVPMHLLYVSSRAPLPAGKGVQVNIKHPNQLTESYYYSIQTDFSSITQFIGFFASAKVRRLCRGSLLKSPFVI